MRHNRSYWADYWEHTFKESWVIWENVPVLPLIRFPSFYLGRESDDWVFSILQHWGSLENGSHMLRMNMQKKVKDRSAIPITYHFFFWIALSLICSSKFFSSVRLSQILSPLQSCPMRWKSLHFPKNLKTFLINLLKPFPHTYCLY